MELTMTTKLALDEYFENGRDFYNCFVVIRGGQITAPVVEASFLEDVPSTIKVEDKFDIYEGDVLVYPKTRQFCYIDDIRHIAEQGYYLVHYHTKVAQKI